MCNKKQKEMIVEEVNRYCVVVVVLKYSTAQDPVSWFSLARCGCERGHRVVYGMGM